MKPLVIIDPGHGGLLDGIYQTNGKMFKHHNGEIAYEGVFNREISIKLGQILQGLGFDVEYTVHPSDPTDMGLKDRGIRTNKLIRGRKAVFISMHGDASESHEAIGWTIFTTKGQNNSDKLADFILDSVSEYVKSVTRLRTDYYRDGDGDKEANHRVTKMANCPSVLIENGFFDNWADWSKMRTSEYQTILATYIAEGISNFVKSHYYE